MGIAFYVCWKNLCIKTNVSCKCNSGTRTGLACKSVTAQIKRHHFFAFLLSAGVVRALKCLAKIIFGNVLLRYHLWCFDVISLANMVYKLQLLVFLFDFFCLFLKFVTHIHGFFAFSRKTIDWLWFETEAWAVTIGSSERVSICFISSVSQYLSLTSARRPASQLTHLLHVSMKPVTE